MRKQPKTSEDLVAEHYRRRAFAHERSLLIHHRISTVLRLYGELSCDPATKRRFKSDIENVLTGPFMVWIRRIVMSMNDVQPDGYFHDAWVICEDDVEFAFTARFLQPTDGTFDRTNAAMEALKNLRKDEDHNHKVSLWELMESGKETKKRIPLDEFDHTDAAKKAPLPRDKIEEFFGWVEEVMSEASHQQEMREILQKARRKKSTKASTRPTRKKGPTAK